MQEVLSREPESQQDLYQQYVARNSTRWEKSNGITPLPYESWQSEQDRLRNLPETPPVETLDIAPTPTPIHVDVVEPAPEPAAAATPEPLAEPAPGPAAEPEPVDVVEPVAITEPEPVAEPTPGVDAEAPVTPEPTPEPAPDLAETAETENSHEAYRREYINPENIQPLKEELANRINQLVHEQVAPDMTLEQLRELDAHRAAGLENEARNALLFEYFHTTERGTVPEELRNDVLNMLNLSNATLGNLMLRPEAPAGPAETEPTITDEVIDGETDHDEEGNAAPGRFRRMWDRLRYAASGAHLYNYLTGRTISAEQQGPLPRKLINRYAGMLAMAGVGAGLYYLFDRHGNDTSAVRDQVTKGGHGGGAAHSLVFPQNGVNDISSSAGTYGYGPSGGGDSLGHGLGLAAHLTHGHEGGAANVDWASFHPNSFGGKGLDAHGSVKSMFDVYRQNGYHVHNLTDANVDKLLNVMKAQHLNVAFGMDSHGQHIVDAAQGYAGHATPNEFASGLEGLQKVHGSSVENWQKLTNLASQSGISITKS